MNPKSTENLLIIGSRPSRLAKLQVKEVVALLTKAGKRISHRLVTFATQGDEDKTTSLLTNPADNFFTNTLDQALLKQQIDLAIHSAKDLPKHIPEGLKIFALTAALDETDAFVGKTTLAKLPKGSRIGTSSLLRKAGISKINPLVEIVDIRGTIEERLELLQSGKVASLIVATCALKRLGLGKKITEIMPWEGTPLQGQLAVVGRAEDVELEKIFSKIDIRGNYGKVYLVGAGPGDPQLMTVKGVKILKKADCVFYDYLVHEDLLDYAPFAEKINVGKRKGNATMPQNELSRLLREGAMEGKTVVRLKGGDPLIFGRGADEIDYLRSYHIEVQVIPGITSATGIPSSLGIPLTARGVSSSVAFLSGHGEDDKHDPATMEIPKVETLVFLMGLTKLNEIVMSLKEKSWPMDTPVVAISKGTRVEERIIVGNISNIEEKIEAAVLTPPALIIVGKTVGFYQEKYRQKNNILYLGTYPEKYKSLGRLIHFPMITIGATKIDKPQVFIEEIKKADMILLTSRCGVKYFFEFLRIQKFDLPFLRLKDFIVIGSETEKQLGIYGFYAKLVSEEETSEGLFKTMKKFLKLKGKKIVFPRSSLTNPYLKTQLSKIGTKLTEMIVYENTKPLKRPLPAGKIDTVIFSSPSTLNNFLEDYETIPPDWTILAKGSRTKQSLTKAGYSSEILVTE